jgi:16S rRNA processing protein RimM
LNQVSNDDLILMGKVIRPHGWRGLLRIWSHARSEASFLETETVFLRSISGEIHEFAVHSIRPHKNVFLMKLDGLETGREAEQYKGAEILIRKEALTRGKDEFFWYELLGLKAYLDTGGYLGDISQIIPTAGNDIYVLKNGDKEFFIPATTEVVKEIDLEKGEMIISDMEGLLDLNEV